MKKRNFYFLFIVLVFFSSTIPASAFWDELTQSRRAQYYTCLSDNSSKKTVGAQFSRLKKKCRSKYPPNEVPVDLLSGIEGKGKFNSSSYQPSFSATIYNGIDGWELTSITVEIYSSSTKESKIYNLRSSQPVPSKSAGDFYSKVLTVLPKMNWSILKAKGYQY